MDVTGRQIAQRKSPRSGKRPTWRLKVTGPGDPDAFCGAGVSNDFAGSLRQRPCACWIRRGAPRGGLQFEPAHFPGRRRQPPDGQGCARGCGPSRGVRPLFPRCCTSQFTRDGCAVWRTAGVRCKQIPRAEADLRKVQWRPDRSDPGACTWHSARPLSTCGWRAGLQQGEHDTPPAAGRRLRLSGEGWRESAMITLWKHDLRAPDEHQHQARAHGRYGGPRRQLRSTGRGTRMAAMFEV